MSYNCMTQLAPSVAPAAGLQLYLEEVRRLAPLEPAEEMRLLRRARRGDLAALGEITVRNLGLVAGVVTQEHGEKDAILAHLEKGNQALLEAIRTFGASGCRSFRRYARSHIRRTIRADGHPVVQ